MPLPDQPYQPLISVITPSYNQGRFIERTLQCVLSQPINIDYVVMDGVSTDETINILKNIDDPRFRWVSEADRGQAHAVNKGISATHGEIIAWLNSDDIYYPGMLAKVWGYFAEHENVDVVYGDAFHIDINDKKIEPYHTEPWNLERLKSECFLSQPAVFFRRRVVQRFGLLDETLQYCMDYEYWLRLAMGGAVFAYFPEPLAGSRMYAQNKTLSQRVPAHAEINQMLQKKFGKVPPKWILNYAYVKASEQSRPGVYWAFLLMRESIWASFFWNREISGDLFATMAIWVWNKLKDLNDVSNIT